MGSSSLKQNSDNGEGRVAVIDIGSNTVRLVVFDGPARVPIPMFNEKVACGLGRGLDRTGRLSQQGIAAAKGTLIRFKRLTEVMGLSRVDLLATAAVREASDGAEFAAWVGELFGIPVQILPGADEAKLSALGILCGFPRAHGLVGDLGGGSLDFVRLNQGVFGEVATLPLGHLRTHEHSGGRRDRARKYITKQLETLDWISKLSGETLYAVGGSWRSVARIFIEQGNYPLHILDSYTISSKQAEGTLDLISGLSRTSLESIKGLPKRRLGTLPMAALVMREVLRVAKPRQIVFCSYGMREGQFLKNLPGNLQTEDPLIASCERVSEKGSRFASRGYELFDWLSPLFAIEDD
ncbi:MAG: Ppx/GppA family phosphatase, partial [Rhodospirillales bacterium]|nr:Ppx/GppA family phosphatase [Rhodospirillales bacterium]